MVVGLYENVMPCIHKMFILLTYGMWDKITVDMEGGGVKGSQMVCAKIVYWLSVEWHLFFFLMVNKVTCFGCVYMP
jgi:hypothetical protein